jgi:hypothetical protein
LDTSLPFVTVIEEDKWNNIDFIKEKIEENRIISLKMREEIREYGVNNFSWQTLIKTYVKNIENMQL